MSLTHFWPLTDIYGAVQLGGTSNIHVLTDYGRNGATNFSVAAWFNTTSVLGGILFGQTSVTSAQNPSTGFGIVPLLSVGLDGILRGQMYDGTLKQEVDGGVVNDGNWHHATLTVSSGGAMVLYLDGTPYTPHSGAAQGSWGWTETWIGNGASNSFWTSLVATQNYPFFGSMADARIYNKVLIGSEVAVLFSRGDVTSGLVGHYPMSSLSAADTSGSGNNGTLNGSPTVITMDPIGGITGTLGTSVVSGTGPRVNTARQFVDDAQSFITLASAPIGAIPGTDWTIALWHQPNDVNHTPAGGPGNVPTMLEFTDGTSVQMRWVRTGPGGNTAPYDQVNIASSDALIALASAAGVFVNGKYTHVALVHVAAGPVTTLYINGVSSSGTATALAFGVANTLGSRIAGDRPLDGGLSEVVVYNTALSTTEIIALYNQGPPSATILMGAMCL